MYCPPFTHKSQKHLLIGQKTVYQVLNLLEIKHNLIGSSFNPLYSHNVNNFQVQTVPTFFSQLNVVINIIQSNKCETVKNVQEPFTVGVLVIRQGLWTGASYIIKTAGIQRT